MSKLKAYKVNKDGKFEHMVVTKTKKEAIEILKVPANYFNSHGLIIDNPEEKFPDAYGNVGKVFKKRIVDFGGSWEMIV